MIKFIAPLILAAFSIPNSKVHGHIKPFEYEMLDEPVHLDCGAVVNEWKSQQKINKKHINDLCTFALNNFKEFAAKNGYTLDNRKFEYNVSFIPLGKNYRELNDTKYRFYDRNRKFGMVSGYTSSDNKYIFSTSDTLSSDFKISFVHELFHAMSEHYEIIKLHPGNTMEEKKIYNEYLAQEFTLKYMGAK